MTLRVDYGKEIGLKQRKRGLHHWFFLIITDKCFPNTGIGSWVGSTVSMFWEIILGFLNERRKKAVKGEGFAWMGHPTSLGKGACSPIQGIAG